MLPTMKMSFNRPVNAITATTRRVKCASNAMQHKATPFCS